MAAPKPFNLFVYGTLMNPSVFRAVLGRPFALAGSASEGDSYVARDAVLHGFKKVSPDNTYLYAVPDSHGRIRGYLIGPLGPECLDALRHYEGRNYRRRVFQVQTRDGPLRAMVFVGNLEQLEHSFGYEFRDSFKQEILLREKIDAVLLEAEREQLHTDAQLARRALSELYGDVIRDLVRVHFEAGGISDYAIRRSLKDAPLRDFSPITSDPQAKALAKNYLELVIRQVIFNQIEERIHSDFRYELDHMDPMGGYYERTVSSVAALRIVNAGAGLVNLFVTDALADLSFQKDRLVDFVQWAIVGADSIYDQKVAKRQIKYIRNHMGRGYIPLGAELEFSNIGHDVIADRQGERVRDARYDGFLYFPDFALDSLTWKLGGHVDDHRDKFSDRRRRGFFEVALGNVSIKGNLSKPITDDPWLLSLFIHETRKFYRIRPHSVHISLQLRTRRKGGQDRALPLYVLKCLFAIAGAPGRDDHGRMRIGRLATEEIVTPGPVPQMMFAEVTKRYRSETDDAHPHPRGPAEEGRYVQQFRFLRLSRKTNYEPIIMALKGIQIHLAPGGFLTPSQYESSEKHQRLFNRLIAWGQDPQPIPDKDIEAFLRHVHSGLMTERRGRPAHSEAYIAWSLSQVRKMLADYNAMFDESAGEADL